MKHIKVALCFLDEKDNILCQRQLSTEWSINLEYDIKKCVKVNIKEEIAEVIVEAIKTGISSDVIKEMIDELESK
jgi:Major capsid protein Gp23